MTLEQFEVELKQRLALYIKQTRADIKEGIVVPTHFTFYDWLADFEDNV